MLRFLAAVNSKEYFFITLTAREDLKTFSLISPVVNWWNIHTKSQFDMGRWMRSADRKERKITRIKEDFSSFILRFIAYRYERLVHIYSVRLLASIEVTLVWSSQNLNFVISEFKFCHLGIWILSSRNLNFVILEFEFRHLRIHKFIHKCIQSKGFISSHKPWTLPSEINFLLFTTYLTHVTQN
jgi:hypothetical protein